MNLDSLALYRRMFDEHPAIKLLIDPESGLILRANAAAVAFYGYRSERLRQLRLEDLMIDPPAEVRPRIEALLQGRAQRLAGRQCRQGGDRRHVEIDGARIDTDEGPALYAIVRDVTEQVSSHIALRDYREIFENVPVPFYRATRGATGRFLRFNPAFANLLDADPPERLFEIDVASLYVDPQARERFSNQLMNQGEVYRYTLQLRTLSGRVIWAADTAYEHVDDDGTHVFDGVLEDITHQHELERELAYQARYDDLTGLANRRHCDELLHAEVERSDRYRQPLSALMLDLDHFKQINDELGHAEGDAVLQRTAGTVRDQLRQNDVAGRWGGEEFMVLLPATRSWGAGQLAEKLRRAVAGQATGDARAVTISVGVAEYQRGEGVDRLLSRLDDSLYAAKHAGRDCVVQAQASPLAASS